MLHPAFAAPGEFFRGNLHCHSNRSDGVLDPAEVCRRYKAEGYDFVALTDHFVGRFDYPITDTRDFRDAVFTTLPGAELHSGAMENGELWHILAVGLPADFAPSHSPDFHPVEGQETGLQIARRAREAGAFVTIAHPHWSGMTLTDARSIEAAHAVEIYNHTCAVGTDRGEGSHVADLLLSDWRDLNLIATDDAHFAGPDHFGGWVMVKAEANEPDLLLEALKDGNFYSSQGPELKAVALNGGHIDVACSPVSSVIVQGHGSAATLQHGTALTQARIPLDRLKDSPWLRVTVIDRSGKRAWSNPIWR
ncbi:PHP domain-containing protein [Pseudophaeobacter sp. A-200-2]|uniref:PHP domain-containing protein n=1 Tax=Pseudophaeobacter sp. A-200-2 TaxID=3098145 RepID=UPI0034D58135